MKTLFYEDWYKKRVQKIINIFGRNWFAGKKILELGAAHGDIGISLAKLGATVTFTDLREEHIQSIDEKLKPYKIPYETKVLNQENKYEFETKFDLVLHLGVLYHLENWKQDLECALNCGNIVILESLVSPAIFPDRTQKNSKNREISIYEGENSTLSLFCQESVETQLTKLGSRFIRFDDDELNTDTCWDSNILNRHIYDWDYHNNPSKTYNKNNQNISVHHRRFWLVIK